MFQLLSSSFTSISGQRAFLTESELPFGFPSRRQRQTSLWKEQESSEQEQNKGYQTWTASVSLGKKKEKKGLV